MRCLFKTYGFIVCLCFIQYSFAQMNIEQSIQDDTQKIVIYPPLPETLIYDSFIWPSEIPKDCPFPKSKDYNQICFLGNKSGFHYGDTFYPTWAENDLMYTPYTDGSCWRLDGRMESSGSGMGAHAKTGQAVILGDDPMNLIVYSLGTEEASALPYKGRYPCGSLHYNGVWYYGTYCLDPDGTVKYGNISVNWPWLGPFVGFRISTDNGLTWTPCPHSPENNLFGECGKYGYPVKIGSPHFVDFGKNMQYSPDGKAYMVAHGADINDDKPRFWNLSWINGDQIYLLRVTPSPENMNDASKWEFYAGKDDKGNSIWSHDFKQIKPLLEWNNNMGCVTITYNLYLKKYLMCVTDGGNTVSKMNTYLLESDSLDGEWHILTYMKNFGEQAYFVNIPSKFIEKDGETMWLLYSGNWAPDWNNEHINQNPPGSHYGLVLQKNKAYKKVVCFC